MSSVAVLAMIIPPDHPPVLRRIDQSDISAMQALVGGYVEAIPTRDPLPPMLVLLNEDGKRDDLPLNQLATHLFQSSIGPSDYMVGTVIAVGVDNETDGFSEVPPAFVRLLEASTEWVPQVGAAPLTAATFSDYRAAAASGFGDGPTPSGV